MRCIQSWKKPDIMAAKNNKGEINQLILRCKLAFYRGSDSRNIEFNYIQDTNKFTEVERWPCKSAVVKLRSGPAGLTIISAPHVFRSTYGPIGL